MPISKPSTKAPARANKSLDDGLKCLQWLLTQGRSTSLQEVAQALGFEMTRTHRLLKTFVHAGFLQQTTGRRYEPGPAMFHAAMSALHNSHLMEAVLPPLEWLRARVKHMVALGQLWNQTVSYLYHAEPSTPIERAIGGCGLYAATSSGIGLVLLAQMGDDVLEHLYGDGAIPDWEERGFRALMAEIRRIRKQGYAFTFQRHSNTYTLALPLESAAPMGVAIAGRISEVEREKLLPLLERTANEINASLNPKRSGPALELLHQRRHQTLV